MSEMKDMLVDVLTKLLKKHVNKEVVDTLETGQWGQLLWQKVKEQQLERAAWQQNGGDVEDLLLLYERIGYYVAPIPFVEQTLTNMFLESVGAVPCEELVTFVFADCVQVEQQCAFGELSFVRWGRLAQQLVIVQPSQILVADCAAVSVRQATNLAAEPRDTIVLNKVPVQCYSITEHQYKYFRALEQATILALTVGAIARAVDLTIQFSKERQQFGRPIHRFQLVQQHLAHLAGERAIASAALDNSIVALQHENIETVSFARLRLDEAIRTVTTSAHQVHAAIGVTFEHSLHHATRRLWAWRDEGMSLEQLTAQLARPFLQGEHDVWSYLTREET